MIKEIDFTIAGKPVVAKRPRVTRWSTYSPHKDDMSKFREEALKIIPKLDLELIEEVSLDIMYGVPIPKSTSQKNIKLMDKGIIKPTKRNGDIDNYIKFSLDALHEVLYNDDCIVTSISASKYYTSIPLDGYTRIKAIITIKEI